MLERRQVKDHVLNLIGCYIYMYITYTLFTLFGWTTWQCARAKHNALDDARYLVTNSQYVIFGDVFS